MHIQCQIKIVNMNFIVECANLYIYIAIRETIGKKKCLIIAAMFCENYILLAIITKV